MATQNTQSTYVAKPLGRGQIRTLTLHAGRRADFIACSLDVVKLQENCSYSALSYTWGPVGDTREILVDNQTVPIRENLWQALQHLRYPNTDRLLWVDALCINQNEIPSAIKEREAQVAMMYTVYGAAERVLVWLGKEIIDGLGTPIVDSETRNGNGQPYHPINPSEDWEGFQNNIEKRMQLYNRDYWSRIWIIQEIMYAKHIIIHFGTQQMSWREFSAQWDNGRDSENNRIAAATSLIVLKNRNDDPSNPSKWGLSTWLHHFKESQCQDPRDKVYGFLGLISPRSRRLIKVDYSKMTDKTLSDLFWNVRRAEQFAHPKENRFLLDRAFSQALELQYLLKPRIDVRLTSKALKLPFMAVYKRSVPPQNRNVIILPPLGMDPEEEDEVLNGMDTYYRYGGRR